MCLRSHWWRLTFLQVCFSSSPSSPSSSSSSSSPNTIEGHEEWIFHEWLFWINTGKPPDSTIISPIHSYPLISSLPLFRRNPQEVVMFQKIIVIKIISISRIKPTQNGLIQEIQVGCGNIQRKSKRSGHYFEKSSRSGHYLRNPAEVGIILRNPLEVGIILRNPAEVGIILRNPLKVSYHFSTLFLAKNGFLARNGFSVPTLRLGSVVRVIFLVTWSIF